MIKSILFQLELVIYGVVNFAASLQHMHKIVQVGVLGERGDICVYI